jgi:spermidine synthase
MELIDRRLIDEQNDRGARLQLWEHIINGHHEMEMIIDGVFIMASYNHLSSELLIRNAMKHFQTVKDINILVGGLGMGFTVKEACSYPGIEKVDVVEIQPAVVKWNHEHFINFNGGCLNDNRVKIIIDDFYDYVTGTDKRYDLISMDIDNGPMMLVKANNERVYNLGFFERIKEIMKPKGIFVIWSCNEEPGLLEQTRQIFKTCYMEEVIEEHSNRQVPYYLYFAINI